MLFRGKRQESLCRVGYLAAKASIESSGEPSLADTARHSAIASLAPEPAATSSAFQPVFSKNSEIMELLRSAAEARRRAQASRQLGLPRRTKIGGAVAGEPVSGADGSGRKIYDPLRSTRPT